jgi:hypothetical protein
VLRDGAAVAVATVGALPGASMHNGWQHAREGFRCSAALSALGMPGHG